MKRLVFLLFLFSSLNILIAGINDCKYVKSVMISPVTTMDNQVVLLKLKSDNFNYYHAKSDGSDLRFTDENGKLLQYYIEEWNILGESNIYVNVHNTGTGSLKLYYGNDSAESVSNPDSTFTFYDDFNNDDWSDKWMQSRMNSKHSYSGNDYGYATIIEESGNVTFTNCCQNDGVCSNGPGILISNENFLIANEPFTLSATFSIADNSAGRSMVSCFVVHDSMYSDPMSIYNRRYGIYANTYSTDHTTTYFPPEGTYHEEHLLNYNIGLSYKHIIHYDGEGKATVDVYDNNGILQGHRTDYQLYSDSSLLRIVLHVDAQGSSFNEIKLYKTIPDSTTINIGDELLTGDNLIAYYPFNGNANDESGNGNNGTVEGATLTSDRFGNENNAYSFDGVDDYIQIPRDNGIWSTNVSVSVWANFQSGDINQCIFETWCAPGQSGYGINMFYYHSENQFRYQLKIDYATIEILIGTDQVPLNTWHHFVQTFDGQTQRAYLNNVLVGSNEIMSNFGPPSTDLFIGIEPTYSNRFLHGSADDLSIYNYALSESDIDSLFHLGGWDYEPEKNLIVSYPFNGNANDESGNGHDGTINGATLTTDRFGNENSAFSFDGADDYIEVMDNPKLNFGSDNFTIVAWVKTVSENSMRVVAKSNHNMDDGYQFGVKNNAHLYLWDSDPVVHSSMSVNDDKWHQLVGIRNDDSLIIYVDGKKDGVQTGVSGWNVSTTHSVKIGCRDGAVKTFFEGIIDDVALYKCALNQVEIDSLYHEGGWPLQEDNSVLFYSDFDNLNGWTNTDPEEYYITNNNLYFAARKGDVQHLYHPISIRDKNFKISTKFKFTGNSANCFICIGVTQDVYDIHDSNSLFNNSIALQPAYTAGSTFGNFHLSGRYYDGNGNSHPISEGSDWLAGYDGFKSLSTNTWYIGEVSVSNDIWTLSLHDSTNNLIYSASNSCDLLGNEFNYFYIGNPTDYNFEYLYGEINWVKVEQEQNPETITLKVDSVQSCQGDTIIVPVQVQFPLNKNYDSAELTFDGYRERLEFIGIDTTQGMIIDSDWTYSVNETDSLLFTASAGAIEVSGSGTFCYLKFQAVGDLCSFAPVIIESAVFNTGTDSVNIKNGGVYILPQPNYGDVDENGLIQAHDAALILKYLVDLDTLYCQGLANADVTNNGTVSALDASVILKCVVSLISDLPYDTTVNGSLMATGDFSMDEEIGTLGGIFEIPIYIENGTNIYSFEGCLDYDPQCLTFSEFRIPSDKAGYQVHYTDSAGKIQWVGAGTEEDGVSGIFITACFSYNNSATDHSTVVYLKNIKINEESEQINVAQTEVNYLVGIEEQNGLPDKYSLSQNYPNPFNPVTVIGYALPEASDVRLSVFDINGRIVEQLVNTKQQAGYYSVRWDASRYSSGVYFYQIRADGFQQVKKMLLIK